MNIWATAQNLKKQLSQISQLSNDTSNQYMDFHKTLQI